ncbi:MAG: efflux transporter outer membrane subunit [Cellvibrio sp.]
MILSNTFLRAGLLALPLLISACSSYKNVESAATAASLPETAEAFSLEGRFNAGQPVAEWWAQLNDAALSQLVQDALAYNHNIRVAQASLDESRALLRNSRYDWFPTVEAEVNAARQKLSEDVMPANGSRFNETYQAGFDASWELDLFGRINNQVRLSRAQMRARQADLRAAQVSVAAEVANAYITLRGTQYLLAVAENNARNQADTFQLTRSFAEVGRADQLDMARAQAQLELTRSSIPTLQAQINTAVNRLTVLTNQPAAALKEQLAQPQSLPSLPAALAVGNPLDLLKRRPDIQRAEQALIGAAAEYNVRVADLYPRITLTGNIGYLSSDWSRLGEEPSETFRFSPSIRWAAFNLGRVQAQIDAADARTQARLAEFEQSVLRALEETDNALQNFSREEDRRLRLQEAAQASTRAAQFARQRFEIGSSDFLSVLDAERSQLDISAQLAQSETQLLLNLIAVYKALGGGWELADPPAQVSSIH